MIYIWIAHSILRLIKFFVFIKKLAEKNQSISNRHRGFRMLFKLERKKSWIEIWFLWSYLFLAEWNQSLLQGSNFI